MAPNPIPTPYFFLLLTLVLCAFIILLFLPALIELKRPKDPGPLEIIETITEEDD
ncbi:MAG: hypothetical protein ACUVRA_01400 [Candidatus Bathyarchaeaceae archaeon]